MKTEFSLAQLANPDIAEADKILRACVHCGFCTATCPTYVLLGDELDSPRGRIYLIKEMLEKDKPPTAEVVKHIDRCLSCLACMTTCPSGVHYMHLVDQARVRIERDYSRPLTERALRALLALVLPRPKLFRASMIMARLARPFAALLPAPKAAATPGLLRRIKAMLALAPKGLPAPGPSGGSVFAAIGRAARAGRAAAGLCPAGAGAAHQPGRHQSPDAPRHRGRAGQGRAMLRRAHPSPRAGRRRAGAGARQHHRVAKGGGTRRPRRHPGHGIGLRHGHQGLWFHAARGPRFRGPRGADIRAGKGYHRVSRGPRAHAIAPERRRNRGLSLGLFAAARTENHRASERIAFQEWIRGERCAREPFVLRFGGDLQHSPA